MCGLCLSGCPGMSDPTVISQYVLRPLVSPWEQRAVRTLSVSDWQLCAGDVEPSEHLVFLIDSFVLEVEPSEHLVFLLHSFVLEMCFPVQTTASRTTASCWHTFLVIHIPCTHSLITWRSHPNVRYTCILYTFSYHLTFASLCPLLYMYLYTVSLTRTCLAPSRAPTP